MKCFYSVLVEWLSERNRCGWSWITVQSQHDGFSQCCTPSLQQPQVHLFLDPDVGPGQAEGCRGKEERRTRLVLQLLYDLEKKECAHGECKIKLDRSKTCKVFRNYSVNLINNTQKFPVFELTQWIFSLLFLIVRALSFFSLLLFGTCMLEVQQNKQGNQDDISVNKHESIVWF